MPETLSDEEVGLGAAPLSDAEVGLEDQIKLPTTIPGMGPFGPTERPEETAANIRGAAGDILRAPGKIAEPLFTAASDLASDWLRRTGIDPSAQSGKPTFERIPIGPGPLDIISPKLKRGIETELGKFTEPGQALLMPFAALKPVQAAFGAGAISAIPESAQEISEAKTPEDVAAAGLKGGLNLGMAYLVGKNLARGKLTPRERTPDAIHPETETVLRPVQQQERPIPGPKQVPADVAGQKTGARGEPVPAATKETVTLTPAIKTPEGIFTGEAHAKIREQAARSGIAALPGMEGVSEGFMTDTGQFIDRAKGAEIFKEQTGKEPATAGELHSEDLRDAGLLGHLEEGGLQKSKAVPESSQLQSEKPPMTVAEPIGMGGATPEEVEPAGTALKNAVGQLERVGLGLPEAYPTVRKNMAKAWIRSGEVETQSPGAGEKLADELMQDPERGMTDEESALLLRHKVSLFNRMNAAAEASHTGEPPTRAAAQALHAKLSEQYLNLLDAIKFRGSQWGREGRWRQALAKEDYSFESADEINRYHRTHTGEDLTPEQKGKAEKIAKGVKRASNFEAEAADKLERHIRQRAGPDMDEAERRAFDAAWKTVREHTARLADEATRKRVEAVTREMEVAGIKAKRAQKILDALNKQAREYAIRKAREEVKRRADPSKPLWEKAKTYLDQGIDNFDDIRTKLATDFGMKVEEVTRLLAQDKHAKYLADDLWKKQQDARRLKEQAKRWVDSLSTPGYQKALASIPKILFSLKVGFHGTVALGTHAPMVAFQPRFWSTYVRDFGKMYKMVANPAYYERQVQDLQRRPNYVKARRAGLVNDPFQFEDYNSPDTSKYFGNLTGMGNRGYSVLKILRQDMFDQHWNNLPKTAQIPEVAKALADGINHATGVVKGKAPRGTNLALFAPRLEASRVMWLAGDPIKAANTLLNWKEASPGDRIFALNQVKEKAWVAGTMFSLLALNAGFLAAVGSKQKINFDNPFQSDFLKFKAAGMDLSYGNAMLAMARLPLRLWVGNKNEGKLNKIIYEDENTAKTLFDYTRSQASPFMGLLLDLAFGRDYAQRPLPRAGFGFLPGRTTMPKRLRAQGALPYSWPEFWSEQLSPIPFQEAIKEVWGKGMGMTDKDIKRYATAGATIAVMAGTGARLVENQPKNNP